MEKNNLTSFLELQVIWKDPDMFELKVSASNGRYSGITEVYNTTESLFKFAQSLNDVSNNNKKVFYEAGIKDEYAFFSMAFYRINNFGHVGVEINLEDNVATEFRPEEKSKLKLEIIVESYAIDNFQKELSHLAINQNGMAILYGRDNSLEVIPSSVKDLGLKNAYEDADKHNWTKAELDAYDYVLMREQDDRGRISKVQKDIARSLLKSGLSLAEIAQHTQLTEEEVEELQKEI